MHRLWPRICGVLAAALLAAAAAVAVPPTGGVDARHALSERFERQRMLEVQASQRQNGAELFDHFAALVLPYGYPLEEHFVTTDDGFVLRLFRIPHGRVPPTVSGSTARRPVVHLQHGLIDAASAWVLNGPERSLAFLLADAGYDVWLGNVRGNSYSRNHTTVSPDDPAFWAWSWDEMALRDLPAMVDYEARAARAPRGTKFFYVGHSQGTTVLLAALAAGAEAGPGAAGAARVARRLGAAALLGPVSFATNISSPVMAGLARLNTDELFLLLGVNEFMPSSALLSRLEGRLCEVQPALCANLLSAISGYNSDNVDASRLPVYLNYTPSGTSVQNVAHWCQLVREPAKATMRRYDYGTVCTLPVVGTERPCNQRAYGRATPPRYDLSRITAALAVYSGGQDVLADPVDIALLLAALPKGSVVEFHEEPSYGHLDFTWGANAAARIYSRVLRVLGEHGGVPAGQPTDKGRAGGRAAWLARARAAGMGLLVSVRRAFSLL